MRIFNRIRPQDITLVQADWLSGPEDNTHVWIATYYGEPVGKVTYNYIRESWQTISQTYCEREALLKEVHMFKDRFDYGQEETCKEEIQELRRSRRVFARFLNRKDYKNGINK